MGCEPGEGRPMQQRSFGSVEYEHKKVKTTAADVP